MYQLTTLFWFRPIFVAEMLTAMYLFASKQRRRPHYGWRVLVCVLACLAVSFAYPIPIYDAWYTSAMFLVLFACCAAFLPWLYEINGSMTFLLAISAYTAQHLAHEIYNLFYTALGFSDPLMGGFYQNTSVLGLNVSGPTIFCIFLYINLYFLVYFLLYFLLIRKEDFSVSSLSSGSVLSISTVILLIDILFNAIAVYVSETIPTTIQILLCCYNILSCAMIFYLQFDLVRVAKMQSELYTTNRMLRESKEQYEKNKENVDFINMKVHNLKYQVMQYRKEGKMDEKAVQDISELVSIYDSKVKTGNDALDLILTEKNLLCQKSGIRLSCYTDCTQLSFVDGGDLYVLFGNLIDNAIEAERKIADEEKRVISLVINANKGFVSVSIRNYYEGPIQLNSEGLPVTTKQDKAFHGYGMKSIRMLVNKYHGEMTIQTEDGVFLLCLLLPIPENGEEAKNED